MNRLKLWWKSSTLNEKLMYALIVVLFIGILTRWNYVCGEIGDAFGGLFQSQEQFDSLKK